MKFVSLSQLLGWPLFGSNSGLFTTPGFIVSLVGKEKKREGRKEGRRNTKGKKGKKEEGVKERENERKEEGIKNIYIY